MRALQTSRFLRHTLLALAALYGAICLAMWAMQERLLFPVWIVAETGPLPPGAERMTLTAGDGVTLEGVYLPANGEEGHGTLLLAFGGNATNAQALAQRVKAAFPDHAVAAFHYRGYAPSAGTPGAAAMAGDAPAAYDFAVARYRPRRVIAIGVSLGGGIAATLAASRPLDGLILVTPFDSLRATARQVYWWLPVGLLLRHDVDSAAALRGRPVPVAIVAAGGDQLVRPERTQALRDVLADLRADIILDDAGHGTIFGHRDFDAALRRALASLSS